MANSTKILLKQGTLAQKPAPGGANYRVGDLLFANYTNSLTYGPEFQGQTQPSDKQGDIYLNLSNDTQIKLANDVDRARTLFAGATSTTATNGQWTANIQGVNYLYDGLTIALRVLCPVNSSANFLKINDTPSKLIWFKPNQRLKDQIETYADIILTYHTTSVGSDTISGTTYTDGWVLTAAAGSLSLDFDTGSTSTKNTLSLMNGSAAAGAVKFVAGSNITLTPAAGTNGNPDTLTITSSYTNSRDPAYYKITIGANSTAITDSIGTVSSVTLEAAAYNDTFTFSPVNKWIKLKGTNGTKNNDKIEIGHALSPLEHGTVGDTYGQASDVTPALGSGSFTVPSLQFDAAGHITDIKNTTITMPGYTNSRDPGYGVISVTGTSNSTAALTATTASITATNYSETFKLQPANKWIVMSATNSTAGNDIIKIAHAAGLTSGSFGDSSTGTLNKTFNETFKIPYVQVDEAGHVIDASEHSIKITAPNTLTNGYTIEYIVGTQTGSATSVWKGVTKDTALYDGKMIMYVLPIAGSGNATLDLTLNNGADSPVQTTGAKNIYRYGGTTPITTHYAAGSRILLIYDATNNRWNSSAWYDSNTNTLLRVYSSATNLDVPLIGQSSANNVTAAWTSYTGTYKDWYGVIPNDDSKRAKINLSTGTITVPGGIIGNASTATAWSAAVPITIGGTTRNLTGNQSSGLTWSLSDILPTLPNSSTTAYFFRGDLNWSDTLEGTFNIEGDILPVTNETNDLGSYDLTTPANSKRWNYIYGKTIQADSYNLIGKNNLKAGMRLTTASAGLDNMDFGWDWATIAGAGAAFRSSASNGQFLFFARTKDGNGNAVTSQLQGTPQGVLTWAGRRVVTSTNSTQIGSATRPVYITNAGYATAINDLIITIGDTSKNLTTPDANDTAPFTWDASAILGGSDYSHFYRGDKEWSNALIDAPFAGQRTSVGQGFIINHKNGATITDYGNWQIGTFGTTSAVGTSILTLGNATASGTAENARGYLRLYASNQYYTDLVAQGNKNHTAYLPNYDGDMYLIHGGNNNAIGGTAQPIYIAANGRATAITSSLGSNTKPIYMESGVLKTSNADIGSGIIPIFLSGGSFTASNSTVGSGVKPIYLNSGTITASDSTVGSGTKPVFLSSGTITVSSSTVGSTTRPVYLNAGTITALSYTANRLYYSASTTSYAAGTHYASSTKVAINSTSEPTENFYVNGNSGFNGDLLPNVSDEYELGSSSKRWKSIHVSQFEPDFDWKNTNTISLSQGWNDVGISASQNGNFSNTASENHALEDGTYVIQLIYNNVTWSGVLTWDNAAVNDATWSNYSEISLHGAGANINSDQIFLRTMYASESTKGQKLQISHSKNSTDTIPANGLRIRMKKII